MVTDAEDQASETQAEFDLVCAAAPIADKLRDHFANGGSIAEGIKLVEFLERAGIGASDRSQSRASKGMRGSRLSQYRDREVQELLDRKKRCQRDQARLERHLAQLD